MRKRNSASRNTKPKNRNKGSNRTSGDKSIVVSKNPSQFAETEAFRQLRTNVEYASYDTDMQVVSVVSANPSEGKSTVCTNLALINTAKYEKVLLIDADLRKPRLHKIFKVSNTKGLTDIVKDTSEELDGDFFSVINYDDFDGDLYLLTSGVSIPNPQEMLGSEKFKKLIEKCRSYFDRIIIDCPPIHAVADAIPISNVCDGTIFVLSAADTDKRSAKSAIEILMRGGANIIGSVLNRVDGKETHYYSKY